MNLKQTYHNLNEQKDVDKMLDVLDDYFNILKLEDYNAYNNLKEKIYISLNGYHFNEELLKEATYCMKNDDDTEAPKWALEQTNSVAKSSNFKFDKYNEYDYNYVMNMLYSDYCKVLGDNYTSYAKMTDKFLNDKDAPEGKALRYYIAMKY